MLNVYELLFGIFILIFFYLFGWEMRHLHTGGSCHVVSGQGCVIMTRFGPSLGSYAQFFVFFYVTLSKNRLYCAPIEL